MYITTFREVQCPGEPLKQIVVQYCHPRILELNLHV